MNGASTNADCQYVWGERYVDDLVLRDRDSDGNSGTGSLGKSGSGLDERLYALQDPNFNVVALAEPDGDVVKRYRYTAYGAPTSLDPDFTSYTGTDYAWPYLYTSRRQDPETGLMHYRNRYYHTGLGRFVSRDPIGFDMGDVNLYRYTEDSPLGTVDPTGYASWPITPTPTQIAGCKAQCKANGLAYSGISVRRYRYTIRIPCIGSITWGNDIVTCKCKARQTCTDAEKAVLQAAVEAACKGPNSGRRCHEGMSRAEALVHAGKHNACQRARNAINQKCFGGGDPGHKKAALDAGRAAARCQEVAQQIPPGFA